MIVFISARLKWAVAKDASRMRNTFIAIIGLVHTCSNPPPWDPSYVTIVSFGHTYLVVSRNTLEVLPIQPLTIKSPLSHPFHVPIHSHHPKIHPLHWLRFPRNQFINSPVCQHVTLPP